MHMTIEIQPGNPLPHARGSGAHWSRDREGMRNDRNPVITSFKYLCFNYLQSLS